ncbi:MAG TPA: hypothetical protein VMU65_07645 [Candidatus Saccharimonadales bacterium]|nr:hypothetical protein [Candidatus Saccharimonadales bacterium]
METPQTAPEQAPRDEAIRTDAPVRKQRPVWSVPVLVVSIIAILALFVVGFTGLFANPVKSVNGDGTTTLSGTFEPYVCNSTSCDGYVSAGARSVFVVFPQHCAPPQRGANITVDGRLAPDLGSASYRAAACA